VANPWILSHNWRPGKEMNGYDSSAAKRRYKKARNVSAGQGLDGISILDHAGEK